MEVFLSYRRQGGLEITRNIKQSLESKGYDVFFDYESIRDGYFNDQIFNNIKSADNFVLILSPNALDRCIGYDDDWVYKEIECAVDNNINIIPVFCEDFEYPKRLPKKIEALKNVQAVYYNSKLYDSFIDTLIKFLKDKNGNPLYISKKKNISNTFYNDSTLCNEERDRIKLDCLVVKDIEKKIWDNLLKDRENIILLSPAMYDVDAYMDKYNFSQIKKVIGLVNSEACANYANDKYSDRGKFYVSNMENDDFEETINIILEENSLKYFDFVDLTLILRDLSNPVEKLNIIVKKMPEDGIVYVREYDHSIVQAYPDYDGKFKHLLSLINDDKYSGDFYAGQKVYQQLRDAYIEDIKMYPEVVTTINRSRKERGILFDVLFGYVPREYEYLLKEEGFNSKYLDAVNWLNENYNLLKSKFISEEFFYCSGHRFYYGHV